LTIRFVQATAKSSDDQNERQQEEEEEGICSRK